MGIFSSPKKPKPPPAPPSTPTRADARASFGGQRLADFSINPSLITNIGGAAGLQRGARRQKKSLIGASA